MHQRLWIGLLCGLAFVGACTDERSPDRLDPNSDTAGTSASNRGDSAGGLAEDVPTSGQIVADMGGASADDTRSALDEDETASVEVDQACVEECLAKGASDDDCAVACVSKEPSGEKGEGKEPAMSETGEDGSAAVADAECVAACVGKGLDQAECESICAELSTGKDDEGPKTPGDFNAVELMVNGVVRQYRIHVPMNLPDRPMPLLVAVHGGGGRWAQFDQEPAFRQLADEVGFVYVYPMARTEAELVDAEGNPLNNEGEWQLGTTPERRQDLNFMEALIDEMVLLHAIDVKRVYAVGYSLGGMFVYELACHLSDRFAAIVSHAGSMPVMPASCAPEQAIGILNLHGVQDPTIPYSETWEWKRWDTVGTMRDVPSLIDYWQAKYACQNDMTIDTADGQHRVHSMCQDGVRVEHHRLETLDHEWPNTVNGTSTHRVVWSFLSAFAKP